MSKRSRRVKQQAKRAALAQIQNDLLQNAPSSIPQQLVAKVTQQVTAYRGPVPPPQLLREYDEVVPGAADRILAMAEMQTMHRVDLEATVVKGDSRRSWVGLWLGFALCLGVLVAGVAVCFGGSPTAGAAIITTTIVSLAGIFVYGQTSRRIEREHKADLAAGKRQ